MSFFIAFFPFDFECAKVQHFIGMAIDLDKKFCHTYQFVIYQCFTSSIIILSRVAHRPDRPAVGSAEGVVQVAVVKTDDELEAFDAVGHVLVKRTRPIGAFVADEARLFIITAIPCRQKNTVAVTSC